MKIGFTGTQAGMTALQADRLHQLIKFLVDVKAPPHVAHHGDCIGADAQFHSIVRFLKIPVVLHPCDIWNKRAHCQDFQERRGIKEPLARNWNIVNESDIMFATPKELNDVMRSGTWSTVRRANALLKPLVLLFPDGSASFLRTEGFFPEDY